jgi:3-hydroxyacyl-CoA dehydrogenase
MGSGIAAHVANAGLPVLLLDIVPPNLEGNALKSKSKRDSFAAGAVKKMLKAKPAPFFSKANAKLVSVGNLDDDLDEAAKCDIIIEAVIERLDIKQALFEKLDNLIEGDTLIASNTSGLRIAEMIEGRSEKFRKNFLVTHFFNPPRYMKLLELVAGPDTDPAAMDRCAHFGKEVLGKGIVVAKDSPNFVANRIGTHSMLFAIHHMLEKGLTPEDVDAMTGIPMGHPKSASFRTGDLVGIDTLVHVANNSYAALENDEERDVFKVPDFVVQMVEKKLLGNKTKGGFYKKTKEGILTYDPKTGDYRPKAGDADIKKTCKALGKEADVGKRVKKLAETEGVVGDYAWTVLSRSMAYAARRLGEICDDVKAIDEGMKWGYNWELGPFETWDALGFAETYDRMKKDGLDLPESVTKMREAGIESFYKDGQLYDVLNGEWKTLEKDRREVSLEIMRKGDAPVLTNDGAEAWDLGDGVLGVTFKSKANSIDANVIQMLHDATDRAERDFQALVVTNQGDHFCVGANVMLVAMAAGQKKWDDIRHMVKSYQGATQRLKYATVPTVAVPYGMTLGGGLELCFGCDSVQAAAETYSGLVEVGVGLIPGGAGCMNMLWRALEGVPEGAEVDTYAIVTQVFKNIALAKVATSAGEAKELKFFRHHDGVSFDRARQLCEAKQRAIGMAKSGYHPPLARSYKLPGENGIATLTMMVNTLRDGGYASDHDALIATKLATVLCGGAGGSSHEVTEDEILDIECEAFVSLCGEKKTMERIQHMLMTNKPLRN